VSEVSTAWLGSDTPARASRSRCTHTLCRDESRKQPTPWPRRSRAQPRARRYEGARNGAPAAYSSQCLVSVVRKTQLKTPIRTEFRFQL
jgi:hypothetical protein